MSTGSDLIQRTDEEQKRAIAIYDSFRDELLKRQLSNTENYDKSILTLSSAGLAISLVFLKSIVPMEKAECLFLMKTSWVFFLLTILVSLVAYLISNAAITKQLSISEDYYVNRMQSAFNKKNWLSLLNNWLNYCVGVLFGIAIIAVVAFVTLNLKNEDIDMTDKKTETTTTHAVLDSATIPTMQRVSTEGVIKKSAQIPTMQAAPGSTSEQSQSTTSQSQQTSSDD
jgi:hypothetical protein